jgi:hypothetical protein
MLRDVTMRQQAVAWPGRPDDPVEEVRLVEAAPGDTQDVEPSSSPGLPTSSEAVEVDEPDEPQADDQRLGRWRS